MSPAMKLRVLVALMVLVCAGGLKSSTTVWDLPPGVPPPDVPNPADLTPARIELGRRLFYDARLSGNGQRACGACHRPEFAFTDTRPRAIGATGEMHARGSMSLINVAYRKTLTWSNPSITTLEQQALVPMFGNHPVELGLDGNEPRVYGELGEDPLYARLFSDAFPGTGRTITRQKVVAAIAAFERTIVSFRSPYDRYRFRGDTAALTPAAKRGEQLFLSEKAGCARCHAGVNFEGASYPSTPMSPAHNRDVADIGQFRPPTLRNIARTAPYMHDGRDATVEDVLAGFALTPAERDDLRAFLDSLTDIDALVDTRWSDPWRTPW
jgi:cytochrome c peroxidase